MNALLLAAGYATRLYPLTRDTPKPLLPVAGRPIAAYMVEQLAAIPEIERVLVVTNARFAPHFQRWAAGQPTRYRVEVVDDGTTTNETRLGAIGDVAFTLRRHPELGADPLFVLGGDNLVDFRLADLVGAYQERNGAPPASPAVGLSPWCGRPTRRSCVAQAWSPWTAAGASPASWRSRPAPPRTSPAPPSTSSPRRPWRCSPRTCGPGNRRTPRGASSPGCTGASPSTGTSSAPPATTWARRSPTPPPARLFEARAGQR